MKNSQKPAILCVCTQNAIRSPMAAAFIERLYPDKYHVESIGVREGQANGFVMAVMARFGINMLEYEPKTSADLTRKDFQTIIALSEEAHEWAHNWLQENAVKNCTIIYWPMVDPSISEGNRNQILEQYFILAQNLITKIRLQLGEDSMALQAQQY